jgi:ASC-1-like (ASCH) protein
MKRETYEWITAGRKTIELRKGKAKKGEKATFLSGRKQMAKGRITRKQEGSLPDLLTLANYQNVVPSARTLGEAMEYIRRMYNSTEGTFTAYDFEIEDQ